MRSAGGTGSPSQQALLEAVSTAVSARQLLVERGIKRVAAVPVVMLGLCYLVTRTDRMRVDPGYACTCCDLCSWQCRGACCVHWLCPAMCSCCGAPCEQPHCLEIYFFSRRCASTRADRHVFARLQPSCLNPHETKLLRLRSPFCSHPAIRATTSLPLCSSLQPIPQTQCSWQIQPASARTDCWPNRKKKYFLSYFM